MVRILQPALNGLNVDTSMDTSFTSSNFNDSSFCDKTNSTINELISTYLAFGSPTGSCSSSPARPVKSSVSSGFDRVPSPSSITNRKPLFNYVEKAENDHEIEFRTMAFEPEEDPYAEQSIIDCADLYTCSTPIKQRQKHSCDSVSPMHGNNTILSSSSSMKQAGIWDRTTGTLSEEHEERCISLHPSKPHEVVDIPQRDLAHLPQGLIYAPTDPVHNRPSIQTPVSHPSSLLVITTWNKPTISWLKLFFFLGFPFPLFWISGAVFSVFFARPSVRQYMRYIIPIDVGQQGRSEISGFSSLRFWMTLNEIMFFIAIVGKHLTQISNSTCDSLRNRGDSTSVDFTGALILQQGF